MTYATEIKLICFLFSEKHQVSFCELLSSNQNKSVWKVEVAILKTLHKFYDRYLRVIYWIRIVIDTICPIIFGKLEKGANLTIHTILWEWLFLFLQFRLGLLKNKDSVNAHSNMVTSLVQQCVAPLCTSLGNIKYAAIRTEALTLTNLIVSRLKGKLSFTICFAPLW